jgi:hypothetical protein
MAQQRRCGPLIATVLLGVSTGAHAQSPLPPGASGDDHAIVYEVGWAGSWSRDEGVQARGGTFAFEITPVEHWLELEVGVSAIWNTRTAEFPIDVLLKKPWRISQRVEFMLGAGPELVHETGAGAATFWGVSSVADFMFWPAKHAGWYVEPGYEVTFRGGESHHGFAVAAGLLIGH